MDKQKFTTMITNALLEGIKTFNPNSKAKVLVEFRNNGMFDLIIECKYFKVVTKELVANDFSDSSCVSSSVEFKSPDEYGEISTKKEEFKVAMEFLKADVDDETTIYDKMYDVWVELCDEDDQDEDEDDNK